MRKFIIYIIVIAVFIGGGYYVYNTYFLKSDEEKIEECLQKFAAAYSEGDFDALCECLDSKSKNALRSILGVGNSFLNIGLEDIFGTMFSLNSISAGEDSVQFQIKDIKINRQKAYVNLEMKIITSIITKTEQVSEEQVTMIKEGFDWKIVGINN